MSLKGSVATKCKHLLTAFAFLLTILHPTNQTQATVTSSVKPEGGKVGVGDYWVMKCDVKDATNIIWYKWIGDIRTQIGYNDVVSGRDGDVISAGRFKLSDEGSSDAHVSTLQLSNAQLEDSGSFQCVAGGANASAVFVVCQDTGSEHCECMVRSGWANPMCLPQQYTDSSGYYKRLLAGLGITLAVAALYVVLATVLYGRDCIVLMHKDRLEEGQKRRMRSMEGRVELSRSKNKKSTVEALQQGTDSDQAHLHPSETVSQASAETAGASEDSGFSGSTQKDRRKATYRGVRNKQDSHDNNNNHHNNYNHGNNNQAVHRENINYAYNDDNDDRTQWTPNAHAPAINNVSSAPKKPMQELAGTMI